MSKLAILGATGSLGKHVVQQALTAGHEVAVIVRTPSKLAAEIRDHVSIHPCDLSTVSTAELAALLAGQDAVINTAGLVTEGQGFVDLIDRLVTSLEALPTGDQPCCWFMAGAGLLDVDESGRRGVDLPGVRSTYWPHRVNFTRISNSKLDWRLLCPGPMVEQPPLGLARLRISLDKLPVLVPKVGQLLPGLLFVPVFASLIPQMIIPYGDAASLMLENLARNGAMSRHRVGIALPPGMRGKKTQWAAQPKAAA
jgi:putative NADH-flavin reductase